MLTRMELCTDCRALQDAGDEAELRPCHICGTNGCRHCMRKGQVRSEGRAWSTEIVCKDPFACVVRHAQWIMK